MAKGLERKDSQSIIVCETIKTKVSAMIGERDALAMSCKELALQVQIMLGFVEKGRSLRALV